MNIAIGDIIQQYSMKENAVNCTSMKYTIGDIIQQYNMKENNLRDDDKIQEICTRNMYVAR